VASLSLLCALVGEQRGGLGGEEYLLRLSTLAANKKPRRRFIPAATRVRGGYFRGLFSHWAEATSL